MAPSFPFLDAGRRKALSVAVRYRDLHATFPDENPQLGLNGTHKDPLRLQKLLMELYGFRTENIRILMDEVGYEQPTRSNIISALEALVEGAQPNDHLVFHFSGHGSQVVDVSGDEEDGMDEVIWPCDVDYDPSMPDDQKVKNYILDDTLKQILVDRLPPDAHLTVLLDCCHSGTGVDLPFHLCEDRFDAMYESPTSSQANAGHLDSASYTVPSQRVLSPTRAGSLPFSQILLRGEGSSLRRNVKGISRSLKMPHLTRGVIISRLDENSSEKPIVHAVADISVPKPMRSRTYDEFQAAESIDDLARAHVTSWSACLDSQLGLDSPKGGILTMTFDRVLRENHLRTNREMLEALSYGLFKSAKEAKHYFRDHDYGELPQPKPCMGSLRPLPDVLDKLFTF